jgi:hypothetical protein
LFLLRPEHFATFVGTKVEEIWFFGKNNKKTRDFSRALLVELADTASASDW